MKEVNINHIEMDLDGDGIPEKYNLNDKRVEENFVKYDLDESGTGLTISGGFGGKMITSDLDYSTEEQLTGKRWIDGKPIYQKTIVYEGDITAVSGLKIEHGISDLETVIFSYAVTNRKDNLCWEQINISDYPQKTRYSIDKNHISITSTWDPSQYLLITIQYTKTTDTELSPVSLPKIKSIHNYSTEEQVVGTWIDGKPIYEKSYELEYSVTANTWYNTNIDMDGISKIFDCKLLCLGTVGMYPAIGAIENNKLNVIHFRNNITDFFIALTIQYTKTTD